MIEPALPISVLDLPPRSALETASRLGFREVALSAAQPGLRPRELDRSARRGLLAELRRLELRCSAIDLFVPREHYADARHVDRALAATRQAVALADDLGATTVFLRLPPADAEGCLSEAMIELAAIAAGARARVADIALDGPPLAAIRSGEDLPVDFAMDTAAWLAAGSDPLAGIVEIDARLAGLRLVDVDANGLRVPVTRGRGLDLESLRTGLELGRFSGAVVLDARGWAEPVPGLLQDLEAWRSLRPEGA